MAAVKAGTRPASGLSNSGGPLATASSSQKGSSRTLLPISKSLTAPDPVTMARTAVRSPRRASTISTRQPRILCYGDSNTAGFCDKGNRFKPYSEALAETLAAAGTCCEVRSCGLSGISTREMVDQIAGAVLQDVAGRTGRGLARILDDDGPYDFAVILSGTNDLALGASPQSIQSDLAQMHAACHERGTATIAMIPPTNVGDWVRPVRQQLAQLHRMWAGSAPYVMACLDAEELVPRHQGLWEKDEIHLSASGSMELGRRLAPQLLPHLDRIRAQDLCVTAAQEDADIPELLKPRFVERKEKSPLANATSPKAASPSSNHDFAAGSEIEVWSNSRKVWCRGHIEKIEEGQAYLCFTLPCGSTARKELPLKHKDLRRYQRPSFTPAQPTERASSVAPAKVIGGGLQNLSVASAIAPTSSAVGARTLPTALPLRPSAADDIAAPHYGERSCPARIQSGVDYDAFQFSAGGFEAREKANVLQSARWGVCRV